MTPDLPEVSTTDLSNNLLRNKIGASALTHLCMPAYARWPPNAAQASAAFRPACSLLRSDGPRLSANSTSRFCRWRFEPSVNSVDIHESTVTHETWASARPATANSTSTVTHTV